MFCKIIASLAVARERYHVWQPFDASWQLPNQQYFYKTCKKVIANLILSNVPSKQSQVQGTTVADGWVGAVA